MMAFTGVILIVATLVVPVSAPAQGIANPLRVVYHGMAANTPYTVSCLSAPRSPGTWLAITGTTYTTQEALVRIGLPPGLGSAERSSILYCFGSDGRPGIIAGAPPQLLLPPGSRVTVYPTAEVMLTSTVGRQRSAHGFAVTLNDDAHIHAGPAGVLVREGEHDISVYPAGATLDIGSGETIEYSRPRTNTTTGVNAPPNAASGPQGCAVSYLDSQGAVARVSHDARRCSVVERELLVRQ